jgi:hypothetical protein
MESRKHQEVALLKSIFFPPRDKDSAQQVARRNAWCFLCIVRTARVKLNNNNKSNKSDPKKMTNIKMQVPQQDGHRYQRGAGGGGVARDDLLVRHAPRRSCPRPRRPRRVAVRLSLLLRLLWLLLSPFVHT